MTLNEFLAELQGDLKAFEEYWKQYNLLSPNDYPLEFPGDDDGNWFEQFITFMEADSET